MWVAKYASRMPYIIKCERVVKDADGSIAEVVCTYDETTKSGGENSGRKVKGTLHWVERDTAVKAQGAAAGLSVHRVRRRYVRGEP